MPKRTGKLPLICYWCKKEYLVYPSAIAYRKKVGIKFTFCSREHKYEWNKTVTGYWKGKKIPYYKRPNRNVVGSKNGRWNGGRRIDKDGYVLIWKPKHPNSDYHGYVREHRLIIEKRIGRYLRQEEVVHHVNLIKSDNRSENLILIKDGGQHQYLHYHNGDSRHLKNYKP